MRLLVAVAVASGCASLNRPLPIDPAIEVGAAEPGEPGGAALATFNVHMEDARSIATAIAADPQLAAAGVLLLQEIEAGEASAARELAQRLGMSYAYAPGYGTAGGGSHGVAILTRGRLDEVEVIELPGHNVVFNSARRIALGATIDIGGRATRIYNVHLDNRINPGDRRDQLAPVLEDAGLHVGMPTAIAGDFNTSPFCWIGHLVPVPCGLQTRGIDRLMRQHGFATPTAGSGATSRYLGMRLDSVFVRDLEVTGVSVADVWLSDHFPLVVTL